MPVFDYKAYAQDGKATKGMVEADSHKTARQKLKKQGLMVTEISERNAAKPSQKQSNIPFMGGSVSAKDMAMVTRQLASLVKANIPLVEALSALVDQIENPAIKVILAQVRQDVNEGGSLAKSMAKHPKAFDTIFVNMVEAGEASGTLGLVLLRLAELKEAQMRLRSKVIAGMTYPLLMLSVGGILVIVIFTVIIPKLAKVFESMNKPMPPLTVFMINMSNFMVDYWYLLVGAIFALLTLFKRWSSSPSGREKWDAMKLKAPIFGIIIRMVAVTRFANTMSTLLKSGVPILTAMNIAKNLVGSVPIEKAITSARENITEGQSIAEPLKRSGEFPPLVIHMIAIGEKTGELPDMLRNVSDSYEEQVNTRIEGMTSLLEPIMLIVMGGFVGFIVLTVMVPLLDVGNLNQGK